MKLELIVPALDGGNQKRTKPLCPPLAPAAVAALTPSEVDVSITDENVTAIDFKKETDLVGITVITVTAKRAYEIADTFRARGVKVILGGMHPSFLPEEAGQHADAVVIGEAEGIWPAVIEDFKTNRLQNVYRQHERPELGRLAYPPARLIRQRGILHPEHHINHQRLPLCLFLLLGYLFLRPYLSLPPIGRNHKGNRNIE